VLVKNQTAKAENGVYVVGVSPARSAEFDTYNEHAGAMIAVIEGTAGAGSVWFCTANAGGILDTTAIDFTKVAAIAGPPGADGEPGPPGPATIAIGTTTTLNAGSSATVTNSGDDEDVVLNFGVPRGSGYGGTSTTSLSISTGSKTFTTQSGLAYVVGSRVRAASSSNWMEGICTAYSGSSLTINVDKVAGSGTFSAWNFSITGEPSPSGSVSGAVSSTDWQAAAANGITGAAIKFGNVIDLVDRVPAIPEIDLAGHDLALVAIGTRASSASFFGPNGLLQSAGPNVPRVTYDPVTRAVLGFLVEGAATNLVFPSEAVASWTLNAVTGVNNQVVAPDGGTTGGKIVESATTAGHFAGLGANVVSGTYYAVSVYLKAAERGFALLSVNGGLPTSAVGVNLSTGGVVDTVGAPLNPIVMNVGNGWLRVSFCVAATSTASAGVNVYISQDGLWANRSYAGDGTSGVYAWGLQLQSAASLGNASSYIKTTSAAVSQSADSFNIPIDTSWLNPNSGTLLIEFTALDYRPDASVNYVVQLNNGGNNNQIAIREGTIITGCDLVATVSSVSQVDTNSFNYAIGNRYRAAFCYALNDYAFTVNGATPLTDSSATVPNMTQIVLGGSTKIIHRLLYYPQRLTNAQMQALTA